MLDSKTMPKRRKRAAEMIGILVGVKIVDSFISLELNRGSYN